jgi:hypothetical protein
VILVLKFNNWAHVLGITAVILELAALAWLCSGCVLPGANAPTKVSASFLPKTNAMAYAGAAVTAAGVGVSLIPAVGPAIGVPVAAGGGTLLILAFVLAKYGGLLALGGLVVMLGGLVVFAWVRLRTYKIGLAEVVAGAQELKNKVTGSAVLAREDANKILASTQTHASTPALVEAVKKELGI